MPQFSAEDRQQKTARCVELSVKGWNDSEIAREVGINRKTVKKLVEDEYAFRAEHSGPDKEASIALYRALIKEGWERLEKLDDNSTNVSGVLNSIRACRERIDKITGAEAPIKHQDVEEEFVVEWDYLDSPAGPEVEAP